MCFFSTITLKAEYWYPADSGNSLLSHWLMDNSPLKGFDTFKE